MDRERGINAQIVIILALKPRPREWSKTLHTPSFGSITK
jgi:hypothetical protein